MILKLKSKRGTIYMLDGVACFNNQHKSTTISIKRTCRVPNYIFKKLTLVGDIYKTFEIKNVVELGVIKY